MGILAFNQFYQWLWISSVQRNEVSRRYMSGQTLNNQKPQRQEGVQMRIKYNFLVKRYTEINPDTADTGITQSV